MGPVTMTYTHFCLVLLLVPLMRLNGDRGPCPHPCRCTLEILNCSRITSHPRFHQVPLPKPEVHPHPFTYLDFTGNAISSTGKEAWIAYPWAEYVVLKDNSLTRLQTSSLEGLLSLSYLDLSCNKIQIIERNAFEAVPFLQIINLSGNVIERITYGTFRAWHSMQFLLKVDLSHNPLAVIQDSYFYSLPSLKLLDLGATEMTPRILEDLLQTSLKLRTLILPKKMSCCLCRIKEDIEVLCETIKLDCSESCAIIATMCEKEEPLNSMQEGVMKVLETRKLNVSSLLNILPERAKPQNDTLAQNYPRIAANFNLLKSVTWIMQMKGDEPLNMNWADKSELKELYLLASLLQAALKEKIMELVKDTPEATVQNELPAQGLEKSTDEATKRSVDASFKKERHVRKVMRENWLQTNQRSKATLFRLDKDGREFAKGSMQSAAQPSIVESHNEAESQRKREEGLGPQRALSFLRPRQAALQSSWKRSILDSPTNTVGTSVSLPLNFLALQDDYLLQGDLFEDELNKQLISLIPNTPSRKLISHVIRILKIDCMAPTIQKACAKLISRKGVLVKLFSENVNETSSLWKSFFWPSKSISSMTTASSRKLEKPSDMIAIQEIPEYGDKLLLAISATTIIMAIIAFICLTEICCQHSAAKCRTFLGRRKKPLPDLEHSRVASLLMGKPPWLKDMYQSQDEIWWKDMADKLHDEESLEKVDIVSWGSARPSLPELPLKKISSKTLCIPTLDLPPSPTATPPPPPPPPPSTPSQKPTVKKDSDTAGGSSKATSSKAASSAADEGRDDEDKEGSAEKSENATTIEVTSEAPESKEGEEEDEEESESE